MKEIWLICSGCYSDINWHGFFETEQEAKEYCEWKNKHTSCDWDRVWCSRVKLMSLHKEKERSKIAYKITTNNYNICVDEIEVELASCDTTNSYEMFYYDEDETFDLHFTIVCNNKDKAIKIAQDTIAQLKEKYVECEDWCLAMESIGGFVW